MAVFRRFNVGTTPYAHYDTVAVDRVSGTLVYASVVGYASIINQISKEINKMNNVYAEGPNYCRTISNGFIVEKRKQSNSDFMHMISYRKDVVREENNNDERLLCYIYCRTNDEKIDRVYDKLYKNTSIPIIKEWIPYIITMLERDSNLRQVNVYYDTTKAKPFDCFCLNITREMLIRIVSNGLQNGVISVNGTNVASTNLNEITGLDSYLNHYGEILANKIQESFVPKFIPGESLYDTKVDDYDDSCYDAGIEIYEAQKAVIQASVNNLNKNDVSFVIGEMGTGSVYIK